ncbi:2780_t:CDS:2, partial [Cetraspora pellucida]
MTNLDKNELAKIGIQFGNLARKWNPKMRPYIYDKTKSKIHILDLQKIVVSCQGVGDYINSIIKKNKTILFLCGFLTNFGETEKRLRELQKLNFFVKKDIFKSLTKKEQAKYEERRVELQSIYEG